MSTALTILNKLKSIDVLLSAQIAIEKTATDAVQIQRDQLFQGVNKFGEDIKPAYKPYTIRRKIEKGQPYDRVTLKDTGAFYRGVIIDVRGEEFALESADEKSSSLQAKYGPSIFGLNEDSRVKYIEKLEPVFIDEIKSYLR